MNVPRLLLATMLLIASSCNKSDDDKTDRSPEAVTVVLAPSRLAPVQREVKVVGTLYGDEEATVSAKVPGRITQILRDVGDRAAAGEPLAQIDRTDYDLAAAQKRMAVQASLAKLGVTALPPESFDLNRVPTVERARLQSANAEAKFKRGEQLYQQNPPLLSEQDFADLKTEFEVAKSNYEVEMLTARSLLADARATKSELDQDLQRLADTTVRAPQADGGAGATQPSQQRYAIAARQVSIGEYVREGTALFRLVADSSVKFRAQVPEKYLGQVKVGQPVNLHIDAFNDTFTGSVARLSPQVDVAARSFQVEMLVPNANGKLQPGAFAEGEILTRTNDNVTLVPASALVTFAGVSKIFTVENDKAIEHKVETGQRVGNEIEITSGFRGPAPVVVDGGGRLATGTPVRVGPPTTAAQSAAAGRAVPTQPSP